MDPNPAEVSDDSIPGSPPIVDMSTWTEASAALLAREKALTRESDSIAAARRRLPMVEVERFVAFMGYRAPWYSVRGLAAPIGGAMGNLQCYLRRGDRVFITYSTTGRGIERVSPFLGLLDITPYGRREGWEEVPEGWPDPIDAGAPVGGHGAPISSCWRTTVDGVPDWGPSSRPVPQWTRKGATAATTLGREGSCH
ncbi:protein of unknown function [Brevibacterium siliguriense]|uniref:DUF899 domain-containing protein n=1 Tax=Brevibacterium siliguriense TaxID=1136497 RepID=A0A1H1SD13_9MICO|nr:DUF899 family protein [Brevibacterium siliguriense]SDS45763.1 protein of unknown function [Brevibacterium siliguriense]